MQKFIDLLTIWLKKNDLGTDSKIYLIEDWRKRGELYHNDAELVIVTESGLNMMLNYGGPDDLQSEFEDLLESFNYFYEMGHSWNLGLYKIDDEFKMPDKSLSYTEKLKNPLWLKKKNLYFEKSRIWM